uniref:Sarcosine dehydrogenase n=1 Tax=Leptobrachium leishanense TaxID=445787 RepID=A0A8C5PTM3_9ANUR
MEFLGRALQAGAGRRLVTSIPRLYSSTAGHTTEKNVPYTTTLKEESPTSRGPSKPLPQSADVVVIGGGSLGCQTVYHLAKMGMKNVVLLERDRLTSGTTWHTAGLLWQLRPSDVEVELLAHTRNVVSHDLEQETGLHTGWIQNGGLFIASNKQRLDEYKRLMSLGKVYGVESYVLSPAETKDLYPLMNVDDLYGTLYVPKDGTMDPAGTCTTLARAATARGAQVIENCPVTGIKVITDDFGIKRVAAVETEFGTVCTPCVVNCAGAWARKLGQMAGVNVPLIAMHHAYVVTERIEGIQNMPNVRDHDASVYLRLQGDALSVGGYESNPIFWEEVSDKFAFGLFDLDWDVFMQHINGAINRVPALEKTGIKSTVCGPESFTADHKPLLGEAPEVRGFFLGCGFNSAGMMLGGGCGKELAHWIIHGRPEKDMYGYDIRRFHHSLTNNNRWIRERSHESYAKNYSVVFLYDEPLAGRNMRKDPLHEDLLDQGCVFQERHGWERPGWFNPEGPAPVLDYDYYGVYGLQPHKDYRYSQLLEKEYTFDFPPNHDVIRSECLLCRNTVAVFNMSYFGKFYLFGPDATKAANWLFTADINKPPGKCAARLHEASRAPLMGSVIKGAITDQHLDLFSFLFFARVVGSLRRDPQNRPSLNQDTAFVYLENDNFNFFFLSSVELFIDPFPLQSRALILSLSPLQSPALILSLSPLQSRALILSLSPLQSPALILSLSPLQSRALILSLSPLQSRALILSLSPLQSPALILSLSPLQSPALILSLSPLQSRALILSLSPLQSRGLILSLSPLQSPALILSLSPLQSQALILSLSPLQSQALILSLSPLQSQALILSLSPLQSPALILSLSPLQSPALILSLSPLQSRALILSLSPLQSPALILSLSPLQSPALILSLSAPLPYTAQ